MNLDLNPMAVIRHYRAQRAENRQLKENVDTLLTEAGKDFLEIQDQKFRKAAEESEAAGKKLPLPMALLMLLHIELMSHADRVRLLVKHVTAHPDLKLAVMTQQVSAELRKALRTISFLEYNDFLNSLLGKKPITGDAAKVLEFLKAQGTAE